VSDSRPAPPGGICIPLLRALQQVRVVDEVAVRGNGIDGDSASTRQLDFHHSKWRVIATNVDNGSAQTGLEAFAFQCPDDGGARGVRQVGGHKHGSWNSSMRIIFTINSPLFVDE